MRLSAVFAVELEKCIYYSCAVYGMEKLTAAISPVPPINGLSAQEFQNMLSSYFEEKGIVSELRSQLRFKMINILRNTAIGREINKKTLQRTSLSKQAINLIVAEFLMQNKYHYSLSIFNTEAALTNIFPEYPDVFDGAKVNEIRTFRFDPENIVNVLELIGIPRSSKICEDLLCSYFDNQENNSILSCLVGLLCNFTKRSKNLDKAKNNIDLSKESDFVRQVGNILTQIDIPSEHFRNTIEHIKLFHAFDIKNLNEKHSKIISELTARLIGQERKLKESQKAKRIVENKLIKVGSDYIALKTQMKKMVKENRIKENKEQDLAKDVEQGVPPAVVKVISASEPTLHSNTNICTLLHCSNACEQKLTLLERLQEENQHLKRKNDEQKEEMFKLSRKYNDLLKDFLNCQEKITLLNSRMNEESTKVFSDQQNLENLKIPKASLQKIECSDISSDSVTEEILREARLRLKVLEEESQEIEENYIYLQQQLNQGVS